MLQLGLKLLLTGLAIVLVGTVAGAMPGNANKGGDEMDFAGFSNRSKQLAASEKAAEVLLQGLNSERNALAKPEEWAQPYRSPAIKSWRDLKFDDPLVPFDKMTYEEKLLVWGYRSGKGLPVALMPHQLSMLAYQQYHFVGRTTPDLLAHINAPAWDMATLQDYLADCISPVTGKLIEVNHQDFSPGNAYVRIVSEEEVKELVKLDPSLDEWWNYAILAGGKNDAEDVRITLTGKEKHVEPGFAMPGKHKPYLVYIRIYGHDGVLMEGLW